MPTATAAATHGQRRRIGAGAAPLLLLRPVVSLHSDRNFGGPPQ